MNEFKIKKGYFSFKKYHNNPYHIFSNSFLIQKLYQQESEPK